MSQFHSPPTVYCGLHYQNRYDSAIAEGKIFLNFSFCSIFSKILFIRWSDYKLIGPGSKKHIIKEVNWRTCYLAYVNLGVYFSVYEEEVCMRVFVRVCVCVCMCLSLIYIFLSPFCPYVCLFVCLSVCTSVCAPVCKSVCLSVRLCVCMCARWDFSRPRVVIPRG
jgi:hypothetical protein